MVVNRNKVKKWFITFPHSGEYTPKSFTLHLFTLACIVAVAGCQETHDDGVTPHLHINIHLNYGLTKTQLLGKIQKKFPDEYKRIDVKSTREFPKSARDGYLSKEDANVWYWTDEIVNLEKKIKKDLGEYNAMSFRTGGTDDYIGLMDIDKTILKWNYSLSIKDNCREGNVIWSYKAKYPWYEDGFIQE